MFNNIGQKIKTLAELFSVLGIVLSVLAGLAIIKYSFVVGILVAIIGSGGSWIGAFFLYGFGELVDNSAIIAKNFGNHNYPEDEQNNRKQTQNTFNPTKNSNMTKPYSAKAIEDYEFFRHDKLTIITIPNSVVYIGESAFEDCTSLSKIVFEGTKAQWNDIAKANNWNLNVPATEVACTDGTVTL